MKHLTKFTEYLKESKEELDLDLIVNDFLVPIKHLGVIIDTYKSLVTSGEFSGNNKTRTRSCCTMEKRRFFRTFVFTRNQKRSSFNF